MRAQLQGLLHQRDVLHPAARLDAKRGRDDHLGLRNNTKKTEHRDGKMTPILNLVGWRLEPHGSHRDVHIPVFDLQHF